MSDQLLPHSELEESPYLNPIDRTSVVDEVIERLISLVINEDLKPGDRLPTERELMVRLGIGRSTLREAVKTLTAVGALEVKRGSGIYVGYGDTSILAKPLAWGMFLSRSSVGQAIEARSVIESALAGWAAERRSEQDLADIEDLLDKLERTQDDKKNYIEYDLKFHLGIARASQNNILFQVLNIFQHLLRVWMETTYDESKGPKEPMKAHRELVAAIRNKDARAAREIMEDHTSGGPLRSAVARQYAESKASPDFISLIQKGK